MREADGRISGLAMMSEDITGAVVQRQELLGWARAFEYARIGVAFIDPTEPGVPRIVRVNPQLARLLDIPAESLQGREVMSLVPPALQGPMRATLPELESTGHVRFESELLDRHGQRVPVIMDITNQPDAPDGQRRRIVLVLELAERNRLLKELAENVEALHQSNQELLVARDALIAANSTRNAILANMSHELRTPLNHVLGFSALLERAELPARERERARQISASGSRLLHLVNSLLDAVRTETATFVIEASDFRLPELFADLTWELDARLDIRELQLVFDIDPALPARIHADRQRLAQVLRELLDNAIKFSSQSAIRISAKGFAVDGGNTRLRIEVEDHGIGIDDTQRARLFGWFQQGDASATRAYGGVGMGLVLAQRIVTLMAGSIGYRATPGGGSTFWIELPLQSAVEGASAESAITEADLPLLRRWLEGWLPQLQAADMNAAGAWRKRPAGLELLLGDRLLLIDTAMDNFDFDIAAELVADALESTPSAGSS